MLLRYHACYFPDFSAVSRSRRWIYSEALQVSIMGHFLLSLQRLGKDAPECIILTINKNLLEPCLKMY
jgi:hypothetical protein